jgi:hypothetical protein
MRSFSPSDREKFEFPVFVDYFCSFWLQILNCNGSATLVLISCY